MTQTIIFDPSLPWPAIWTLCALLLAATLLSAFGRLRAWPLRLLAATILITGILRPSLQTEQSTPLTDIILAIVDDSASQKLGNRATQTEEALSALTQAVAALPSTELTVTRFTESRDNGGSQGMQALTTALLSEPRGRIAGIVMITDGQIHDVQVAPPLPAPLHVLLTGTELERDRRLTVTQAPPFAILGQEFSLNLRIDDLGENLGDAPVSADLTITVDDQEPQTYKVPVGEDLTLPITLQHGGMNVLHLGINPLPGELTTANNAALIQINGIRDRLQVLLVSGEPHAGERVWRNLLKSDASVDLVHFTILRPPEKQDGTPVEELALIAFPTRELFVEKLQEFDLIIFDRYRMRDLFPPEYIDNVVAYVRAGGTVLVSAGPEYGAVDSLWRTPLADILPAEPTSRIVEGGFRPELTPLGRKHPVTESLERNAPAEGWGRWFRLMEVRPIAGEVLMEGPQGLPLLVLDRVDQGRIAVLASDQSWLWGRGFEGGGPQLELLKRLTHWMLKEPELEEEALSARYTDGVLTMTRRTIQETEPGPLTLTAPDTKTMEIKLVPVADGRYETRLPLETPGLYRIAQDGLSRMVGIGPAAPKEFLDTLAAAAPLAPIVSQSGGTLRRLSDGFPNLRLVNADSPAFGRGWIGFERRGAKEITGLNITAILPTWAYLVLVAAAIILGWLIEGRRRTAPKGVT